MVFFSTDAAPEPRHAAQRLIATPPAGLSTETAAACTTSGDGSAGAGRRGAGSRAGSSSRLAPRAVDAAGQVHRAVLPGRGDGVRGRAPSVRALPARGLRALRRSGASSIPGCRARTRSTRSSRRSASTAGNRGSMKRRSAACPTARSCSSRTNLARLRRRAPALDAGGLRGPQAAAGARPGDHSAVADRGAPARVGKATCPLLHPSVAQAA